MMRALFLPFPRNASPMPLVRPLMASSLLALVFAINAAAPMPASAQNSPGSFSLPTPSPTPTPATQGPVDERSGVQIAPRTINPSPPPIEPQPTLPTQTPEPAPTPTPTPAATSAPPPRITTPAARAPSASSNTSSNTPASTPAQQPSQNAPLPNTSPQNGPIAAPGFDTDLIPNGDEGPIGPDDWYDVSPGGERGSAATANPATTSTATPNRTADRAEPIRNSVYIGLALMALIGAALAWLYWRRRKQDQIGPETDGSSLAFGVHKVINQTVPSASERAAEQDAAAAREAAQAEKAVPVPAAPTASETAPVQPPSPAPVSAPPPSPVAAAPIAPAPQHGQARGPARVDLGLDIVGGSRSVMMFSVDFRLDIANRADFAVRDIKVSAQLVCAQSGVSGAATMTAGHPIAALDRIGPQQGQRVSGDLQLPLNAVKAIRQGSKPLFIPMLHIEIAGSGFDTINRSFVIGTPSVASQTRVHPLPLDGPPGGLPSLRAQLIKQPAVA